MTMVMYAAEFLSVKVYPFTLYLIPKLLYGGLFNLKTDTMANRVHTMIKLFLLC